MSPEEQYAKRKQQEAMAAFMKQMEQKVEEKQKEQVEAVATLKKEAAEGEGRMKKMEMSLAAVGLLIALVFVAPKLMGSDSSMSLAPGQQGIPASRLEALEEEVAALRKEVGALRQQISAK